MMINFMCFAYYRNHARQILGLKALRKAKAGSGKGAAESDADTEEEEENEEEEEDQVSDQSRRRDVEPEYFSELSIFMRSRCRNKAHLAKHYTRLAWRSMVDVSEAIEEETGTSIPLHTIEQTRKFLEENADFLYEISVEMPARATSTRLLFSFFHNKGMLPPGFDCLEEVRSRPKKKRKEE